MYGKIHRLPAATRDEICERLNNGQTAEQILGWVNALAPTRKMLRDLFDGKPISPQNLSTFRQGSYFKKWMDDQRKTEAIKDMATFSMRAATAAGGDMGEGAVAILAGKIMTAAESADPEEFEKYAKALHHIRNAELQARAARQRDRSLDQREREIALREESFRMKSAEALLEYAKDKAVLEIVGSREDRATKLKKLVFRMFGERPDSGVGCQPALSNSTPGQPAT